MSQQLFENKAYLGLGLGLCFGEGLGLGLGFSKGLGLGLGIVNETKKSQWLLISVIFNVSSSQ